MREAGCHRRLVWHFQTAPQAQCIHSFCLKCGRKLQSSRAPHRKVFFACILREDPRLRVYTKDQSCDLELEFFYSAGARDK